MIQVITKQAIGFRNGDTGEIVTAKPYDFTSLPDWVKKDPMYDWAVKAGVLEVAKASKTSAKSNG